MRKDCVDGLLGTLPVLLALRAHGVGMRTVRVVVVRIAIAARLTDTK